MHHGFARPYHPPLRRCLALATASALVVFLSVACRPTPTPTQTPGPPTQTPAPGAPNILFILVDDLDTSLVNREYMPRLNELLVANGLSFTNFFIDVSICCPSRSSILRGQYMHNTGIYTNVYPGGGFQKFNERGLEASTAGVWLRDAGYYTALVGKYLNGYPAGEDENYIPPGWDEWHVPAAGLPYSQFDYTLNENGTLVDYGSDESDYLTDVLSTRASAVIDDAAAAGRPFFMYLAPYAPHEPARPAPRHAGLFPDTIAPRTPAFNEADMSDKPNWLRTLPLLDERRVRNLDGLYRNKARSMVAVDEMIGNLVDHLKQAGQLDRTYIFFTSDNGFHIGTHRLPSGKYTPYEEDIHLPLFVAGPGVPKGATSALAMNIDLAPTFAELAGAATPDFVDGRSLGPILRGQAPSDWRTAVLYEQGSRDIVHEQLNRANTGGEPAPAISVVTPDLRAIRTERYMYVEYSTGDRELYDLAVDPYQVANAAASADPSLLAYLSERLGRLSACRTEACRAAEDESLPPGVAE